jgi:hypothetical protein
MQRCKNADVPASSDRFSARHSAKLNARCTGRESILNPGLSSPQFYELSTLRMVNLPATDATSVADQPSPLGSGRRNARLSPSPVPCPAGSPTCGAFYCLRFGDSHPRRRLGMWNAAQQRSWRLRRLLPDLGRGQTTVVVAVERIEAQPHPFARKDLEIHLLLSLERGPGRPRVSGRGE